MRLLAGIIFFILCTNVLAVRVMTTSPALTEIVIALGAEDSLVAVSDYCPQKRLKKKLPTIGTAISPRWEKIYGLKADLLLVQSVNINKFKSFAKKTNLEVIELPLRELSTVFTAIRVLKNRLGKIKEGDQIERKFKSYFNKLSKKNTCSKVLVAIDYTIKSGALSSLVAAGKGTVYRDLFGRSGLPLLESKNTGYQKLGLEKVLSLAPKYIFFLMSNFEKKEKIGALQEAFKKNKFLQRSKLIIIQDDRVVTPGPTMLYLLKEIERLGPLRC